MSSVAFILERNEGDYCCSEQLSHIRKSMNWEGHYPIAEFIACCGFFLVFLVEELVLKLIPGAGHGGHSHVPPNLAGELEFAAFMC